MTRIGLWNQFNGRGIKGTKCEGLYDDNKGRRSIKSVVGWITEDWTNSEIKVKICCIILLYFKKEWVTMISTGLQKIEPSNNKEQDTITFGWRGYWQIGSHLGI